MSKGEPRSERIVRQATYSHQTEGLVRDMILNGSLAPGERINEVALATELGISRGPLREALQRLAGSGLVNVIGRRGAFIREFDRDELVDLYELRTAMEAHAARLACHRTEAVDLDDLQELLDQTRIRIANTKSRAYPGDLDFHSRLVGLARNPAVTRTWVETQQKITLARVRSAQQPIRARAALVEHTNLVQAIRARDEERAARLVMEHLEHSMQSALRALNLAADETSKEQQ